MAGMFHRLRGVDSVSSSPPAPWKHFPRSRRPDALVGESDLLGQDASGRVRGEMTVRVIRLLVVFGLISSLALAAPPTARDKELITQAMLFNCDACNREDIEDVMRSCADAMPERDKFRHETLSTFEEKDIHTVSTAKRPPVSRKLRASPPAS